MNFKSKIAVLFTPFALFGASVSSLNSKPVFAYDSPSVSPTTEITTVKDGQGNEFEAVLKQDSDEDYIEWIISMDVYPWSEVKDNPEYTEAEENTRNFFVLTDLTYAYETYLNQPVRAFDPDYLTSELAQELGENSSFDATNLCVTYMFDLRVSDEIDPVSGRPLEDVVLEWLYAKPDRYIEIIFHFREAKIGNRCPVIVYQCDEDYKDPKDTSEQKWKTNDTGVILDAENAILKFRFYNLCPMMLVQAAEETRDNTAEYAEKWNDPTSPYYVPINDGFKDWIIPVAIATTLLLTTTAVILFFVAKKKNEEEGSYSDRVED